MNEPPLQDLQILVTVAGSSSFSAAAQELGISQAYVSKRIAELERTLGVRLFHRSTRRLTISADGEIAFGWAQTVLRNLQEMRNDLASARAEPAGLLKISTSLRLGRNHVSHILALLQQRHPALELWLELVDRRTDLVSEGFDIDIRVGDVTEQQLIAHHVASSDRILCAAPDYLRRRGAPRTLADLAHHDCLLFRDRDQPFGVWRLHGPGGAEAVKVRGRSGSNHSDPVRNWAIAGCGIILLAGWDVADALESGELVRVLPAWRQPAEIWAVTSTRLSGSAKVRVCIDFLVEQLKSGPYALKAASDVRS